MAGAEKFIALYVGFFESFCHLLDQWAALPYDVSGPRLCPVLLASNTGTLLKSIWFPGWSCVWGTCGSWCWTGEKKPYALIDFRDFWRACCLLIYCGLYCKCFFNYFQSSFPEAQHLAVPSDYHQNRGKQSDTVTLLPVLYSIIAQPVFTRMPQLPLPRWSICGKPRNQAAPATSVFQIQPSYPRSSLFVQAGDTPQPGCAVS